MPRLPRPRPIRYVMGGPKATPGRSTWRLNYSKQASKSGHGGVLRAVGCLVDRQGAFQQRPGRRRLPSGLQVSASAVEQPGGRARLDRVRAFGTGHQNVRQELPPSRPGVRLVQDVYRERGLQKAQNGALDGRPLRRWQRAADRGLHQPCIRMLSPSRRTRA